MEHTIILVVGSFLGLMQGFILLLIKQSLTKLNNVCVAVTVLQREMNGKITSSQHKEIEVLLGKYGNRILKLEMKLKMKEVEE
jgi:hypothetical protein